MQVGKVQVGGAEASRGAGNSSQGAAKEHWRGMDQRPHQGPNQGAHFFSSEAYSEAMSIGKVGLTLAAVAQASDSDSDSPSVPSTPKGAELSSPLPSMEDFLSRSNTDESSVDEEDDAEFFDAREGPFSQRSSCPCICKPLAF